MLGALAAFAAFVAGRVLRIRRAHVRAALARAGLDPKYVDYTYAELGRSLVELVVVALGLRAPVDYVEIDAATTARIRAAHARGPVLFLCAHTSNWELVAMRAAQLFPLALIVKPMSVGLVQRMIARIRARGGIAQISVHGAAGEGRRAIARGEIVATVIDQVPATAHHGDVVPFLGADALVDRGPAVMAKRAHATAFVIVAARDERKRVIVRIADEIPASEIAAMSVREIARRATLRLESHVRAHPESWLFLHRRWKGADALGARKDERADWRPAADPFLAREKAVIRASS